MRNRQVQETLAPAMAKAGIRNLGIRCIDHVDFVVHDLERSAKFYTGRMDMAMAAKRLEELRAKSLASDEPIIVTQSPPQ